MAKSRLRSSRANYRKENAKHSGWPKGKTVTMVVIIVVIFAIILAVILALFLVR